MTVRSGGLRGPLFSVLLAGGPGASLDTLEKIDAVTDVTPGSPLPRHSGTKRDERA